MEKRSYILLGITILFALHVKAQDPEFTQFYANQLYLNPAFAGSHNCPRVNVNYRNQWPGLSGTFVTHSVSYDQGLRFVKGGGGGLLITNDVAAKTLSTLNVSGIYAQQFPITRQLSLRLGAQVTYYQKKLDWNKLTFGDMIDPRRGFVYQTADIPRGGNTQGIDFSAGALLFSKRFYAGVAVHHLAEPNESLVQGNSPLPRKYTGHAGAVIPLSESKYSDNDAQISPNILFRQQGTFQQLNLGLYITKSNFWGGVWYRNADAFILLVGMQSQGFKIGYSYDVTTSKLTLATAGSHEISLGLNFTCKPPRKRYRTVSCPSF